jgi:tRNA dimethylallyltransferase
MKPYKLQANSYKLIVIVGPTSSGKSELAVKLAKLADGEIISCDSRQIYRGMNLGTGKVNGRWATIHPERVHPSEGSKKWLVDETRTYAQVQQFFFYKNIAHHCIDFVNPKKQYSAALFQRDANKAIADILRRGKLPILCGGTAHWINAVIYDQQLPDVKPNLRLRSKLEKQSAEALFKKLVKIDPARAKIIDRFNKRRLIRALEIIMATGKPVPQLPTTHYPLPTYDPLWLGINPPQNILFDKIKTRLKQRLKAGMIKEVRQLHAPPQNMGRVPRVHPPFDFAQGALSVAERARGGRGLSWPRLESFGMEYKFASLYLQKKISYNEMFEQLFTSIKKYTKRQMTWWKRNKDVKWIKNPSDVVNLVAKFLK